MTERGASGATQVEQSKGKAESAVRVHVRSILLRLASRLAEKQARK